MNRVPSFYTTRSILNLSGLSVADPLPDCYVANTSNDQQPTSLRASMYGNGIKRLSALQNSNPTNLNNLNNSVNSNNMNNYSTSTSPITSDPTNYTTYNTNMPTTAESTNTSDRSAEANKDYLTIDGDNIRMSGYQLNDTLPTGKYINSYS